MKTMTKERLAMLLDGNEYLEEMTREQERIAAENNLLVLFCQSDDLLEMRGAIHDEEDAMDGGEFALLLNGEQFYDEEDNEAIHRAESNVVMRISDEFDNEVNSRFIRVEWSPDDARPLSWRITSNLPCAVFTICESGEPFCEGVVIDLDEIEPIKML